MLLGSWVVGSGLCLPLCLAVLFRSVELAFVNLVPLVGSQGLIWLRWTSVVVEDAVFVICFSIVFSFLFEDEALAWQF